MNLKFLFYLILECLFGRLTKEFVDSSFAKSGHGYPSSTSVKNVGTGSVSVFGFVLPQVFSKSALTLFYKNRRFDLIYKVKLAQALKKGESNAGFYRSMYLASTLHVNDFFKIEPGNSSAETLLSEFDAIFKNIYQNGFNFNQPVFVYRGGELSNDGRRLAVCVALSKEISLKKSPGHPVYRDYRWFAEHGLPEKIADWGALEYIKLNPKAHVVNLFPVLPLHLDAKVEKILNKYGFIYYKKSLLLTLNGCMNLRWINYGTDRYEPLNITFLGSLDSGFAGLRDYAEKSMGGAENGTVRVLIFVCKNLKFVNQAKSEIRALLNIGKFPVHVNDVQEEAVELAQTYFNENTWFAINHYPFNLPRKGFDALVTDFRNFLKKNRYNADEFCAILSAPMGVFGLKEIRNFDFIHLNPMIKEHSNKRINNLTIDSKWLKNLPVAPVEIILNPRYHFYYRGVKFITLEIAREMKSNRNHIPEDPTDVEIITKYLSAQKPH